MATILLDKNIVTSSFARKTQNAVDDGSVFVERDGEMIHYAPGDLVRPLCSIEIFMAMGGFYNDMNTVQAIWLESKTPIDSKKVSLALSVLSREISVLQLCLARRGPILWFKRIKNFEVNFDTADHQNPMQTYEELLSAPYDMLKGPLWRARLVPLKDQTNSYTAVLIFSVQHSITDGTTNTKICRETVNLLNQIEAGSDVAPKFHPLPIAMDDRCESTQSYGSLGMYTCQKVTSVLIKNFNKKSSFSGAFPLPQTKESRTKVLCGNLSIEETSKLIKQCKAENVTVHSCMTNLINFALLRTAHSRSQSHFTKKTSISHLHCINIRRYYEQEQKDIAGCHIAFMDQKARTSLADAGNFWSIAREVHAEIKTGLDEGRSTDLLPIVPIQSILYTVNNFLKNRGYKSKTDCHYATTNMGNLKDLLPEPKPGDQFEIVDILRSVHCPLQGIPMLVTFHTFRDRFMVSLDYYTNKVSDELAQDFFRVLFKYIRRLAETGSILSRPPHVISK